MPLLWHVWYKDTVQVSDGFGNKQGVLIYHIKLQLMHVCKLIFGISLLCAGRRGDCSIMLEYQIIKSTEYTIRISILDTHPYSQISIYHPPKSHDHDHPWSDLVMTWLSEDKRKCEHKVVRLWLFTFCSIHFNKSTWPCL